MSYVHQEEEASRLTLEEDDGFLLLEEKFARPSADSVDGSWLNQDNSATNLYASLDESSPSDTDFIYNTEVSPNKVRLKLQSITAPSLDSNHIIRWRLKKVGTLTRRLTLSLYQGGGNVLGAGTLIASWTRDTTTAWTTYEEPLSEAQAANITDYSDLYIEITETIG